MMINNTKELILIIIGSFLAQIVQVGVFSLFLAQLLSSLNISLSVIGWFIGIQWIAVLCLAPFVPAISGFIGLKRLNVISGLISVGGILIIYTGNEILIGIASLLMGAGLIMRWIVCDTLVVHLSPENKVGRMIGIHETLMGLGIAVGPLLFAVFILEDVIHVMVAILFFSTIFLYLSGKDSAYTNHVDGISVSKNDFTIIKIALIAALVGGFIETAAVAFFPFYFEADGFSLESSVWFVSAFGFGGTLLQLPLGYLADLVGYRRAQLIACFIASISLLALFLSASSFVLIYGILFIMGGAVGAFNTLAVIQAGSEIPENKSASAMAYIAVFYTLGSIVGPVITANALNHFNEDAVLGIYFSIIAVISMIIIIDFFRPSASDTN